MPKVVSYWNVVLTTIACIENGEPAFIAGTARSCNPTIENGFLMYTSPEGFSQGVNLAQVAHFSIEPVYLEGK